MSIKEGRGGRRPGSGRPRIHPDDQKVTLTIRVRPDTIAWLKDQPGTMSGTVQTLIDYVLAQAANRSEAEVQK